MSETQELKFGDLSKVIEFGPWIAWGARHVDEIDDVVDEAMKLAATPVKPLRPWWEQFKGSGDTVVGVAEDAPIFSEAITMEFTCESIYTEALKFGNPERWARFLAALPSIIALISKLAG